MNVSRKKVHFYSTRLRRKTRRGMTLFSLSVILVLSLVIAGIAYAFTVGNTDGTWGTIDTNGAECNTWATGPGASPTNYSTSSPSVQTPPNTDENQVRYGDPVDYDCPGGSNWKTEFSHQSGFGFDGNNGPVSPAADTPFYLGKFTHYNNPIYADNSFQYVDLTTSVPVTCNDGTTTTSFSFSTRFTLDETSNSTPCAYPGSTTCPDKVTVTQPTTQTFTCPDGDYTVNILGFTTSGLSGQTCDQSFNPAAVATQYITEERSDNVACLWAEITAPTADITPEKTCANFDTADPYYRIVTTNLGPGSARQVQIVDTIPTGAGFDTPLVYSSQLTTTSGGTVSQGTCSVSGQTITCQLLTSLSATSSDPLAKWTVDLHVFSTSSEPTVLTNSVTASMVTTDLNTSNNTDTCQSEAPTNVDLLSFTAQDRYQSIDVRWETASEVDILSFNLVRATSQEGVRSPAYWEIAKHSGKLQGDVYQFVDTDVQSGVQYYYWLEVQAKDGKMTVLGPADATVQNYLFLPAIQR